MRQVLGSFEARFRLRIREEMSSNVVYAIVKAGGRQEKVSVGDVVVVDKLAEEIGSSIELQPLMLVDGDAITVDAAKLGKVSVKAEVVDSAKGPKISIRTSRATASARDTVRRCRSSRSPRSPEPDVPTSRK